MLFYMMPQFHLMQMARDTTMHGLRAPVGRKQASLGRHGPPPLRRPLAQHCREISRMTLHRDPCEAMTCTDGRTRPIHDATQAGQRLAIPCKEFLEHQTRIIGLGTLHRHRHTGRRAPDGCLVLGRG